MDYRKFAAAVILVFLISCQQDTGSDSSVPSTRWSPPSYELKPAYDYVHYPRHIKATLWLAQSQLTEGQPINCDIRFDCVSGEPSLYNTRFDPKIPPPAALAIFDNNGHYLGDLLEYGALPYTGRRTPIDHDWLYLKPGQYFGTHLIHSLQFAPTQWGAESKTLGPGKYKVQLILYKSFAETNPYSSSNLPTDESFRSNSADFEVVPSEGIPAAAKSK